MDINESEGSSSLKGVRDDHYLLGLVDLEDSPGTYTFVVCAHKDGEVKKQPNSRDKEDQCTYAFLNDQRKPVPISVDFFPEEDLSVKELAYLKTVSSQYWSYRRKMRDNAYDSPDGIEKVAQVSIGGGAVGYAFGRPLKGQNIKLDNLEKNKWPLYDRLEKLENKFKVMTDYTLDDDQAAKAVRNLIKQEVLANESVFDDNLVKWLDAEGLPSSIRAFLSNNGFSIGHYLQNPYAFYNELLTDVQRQALVSVLGQESDELGYNSFARVRVLDDMVAASMKAWLVQSGQAVDARLLFKAGLRETIVNQFLKKYGWNKDSVLARMGSARALPKSAMMNYHMGIEDPHHLELMRSTKFHHLSDVRLPFSDVKSSNFYGEFSDMMKSAQKFNIKHAFAKGVSNHYDIFYNVVPYKGYRWLVLQNQITVTRVKQLESCSRLRIRNGLVKDCRHCLGWSCVFWREKGD